MSQHWVEWIDSVWLATCHIMSQEITQLCIVLAASTSAQGAATVLESRKRVRSKVAIFLWAPDVWSPTCRAQLIGIGKTYGKVVVEL